MLEAGNLVVPDSIGLQSGLAYSSEFGNFKRLRIAGRSVPSGELQGLHLLLTPKMENKIVELAKFCRREEP